MDQGQIGVAPRTCAVTLEAASTGISFKQDLFYGADGL